MSRIHRWSGLVSIVLAAAGDAAACAAGGPDTATPPSARAANEAPPPELGAVRWLRDFDAAAAQARERGLPLLVLFTEVSGCAACTDFGSGALSHPLIVEAAESLFVPVAVLSNADGPDKAVLESFNEPAQANPVVRIMSPDRADLVPRLGDERTVGAVTKLMEAALTQDHSRAPGYLSTLREEEESAGRKLATVLFEIKDGTAAEAKIGGLSAVVQTKLGTREGADVLEATFDPARQDYLSLLRTVWRMNVATAVVYSYGLLAEDTRRAFGPDGAKRGSTHFTPTEDARLARLRESPYRAVPMTPVQALRINSALHAGRDADLFLSPRQIRFRGLAMQHSDAQWPILAGRSDLARAFAEGEAFLATLDK